MLFETNHFKIHPQNYIANSVLQICARAQKLWHGSKRGEENPIRSKVPTKSKSDHVSLQSGKAFLQKDRTWVTDFNKRNSTRDHQYPPFLCYSEKIEKQHTFLAEEQRDAMLLQVLHSAHDLKLGKITTLGETEKDTITCVVFYEKKNGTPKLHSRWNS